MASLHERVQSIQDALATAHDTNHVSSSTYIPTQSTGDEPPVPDVQQQFKKAIEDALRSVKEEQDLVTTEDKLLFIAHVLTDKPFLKRFDLIPKSYVIYKTLPSNVLSQYIKDISKQASSTFTTARQQQAIMITHIERLVLDEQEILKQEHYVPYYEPQLDAVLPRLPLGLQHMLSAAYKRFVTVVKILSERGLDQSFWTAP